jgi:hypothetical protein
MRSICNILCLMALFVFSAQSLSAQEEQSLFHNNTLKRTGTWLGYRLQMARYFNQTGHISGFHLQSEFNRKYLIGLNYNFNSNYIHVNTGTSPNPVHLKWTALHLGYRLRPNYVIHPIFEIDMGGGAVQINEFGSSGMGVFSPAAGIEFHLTRWMHFTISGGYRWMTSVEIGPFSSSEFTGSFAQFGVRLGRSKGK